MPVTLSICDTEAGGSQIQNQPQLPSKNLSSRQKKKEDEEDEEYEKEEEEIMMMMMMMIL